MPALGQALWSVLVGDSVLLFSTSLVSPIRTYCIRILPDKCLCLFVPTDSEKADWGAVQTVNPEHAY